MGVGAVLLVAVWPILCVAALMLGALGWLYERWQGWRGRRERHAGRPSDAD
jgi:hypothetical protein